MGNFWEEIKEFGEGIADTVEIFGDRAYDAIKDIGQGVLDAAGNLLGDLLGALIDVEIPEPETGILVNNNSRVQKIPIVYGARRVGGVLAIPGWVSGDNNEYLHLVLVLCEGEIEAIDTVYINDIASTDAKYTGFIDINSLRKRYSFMKNPIFAPS